PHRDGRQGHGTNRAMRGRRRCGRACGSSGAVRCSVEPAFGRSRRTRRLLRRRRQRVRSELEARLRRDSWLRLEGLRLEHTASLRRVFWLTNQDMGRPSNREQRRREILQAFAKVLADHGYAGATIAAVATEAGVAPGLVHHHFESKAELTGSLLA